MNISFVCDFSFMICIISTDDFSWGQHYFVLKYEEILVFWCVWCLTQCFRASLPVMFHCLCCLILILKTEARGKGGAASGGGNSWRGGGKRNIFFCIRVTNWSFSCSVPDRSVWLWRLQFILAEQWRSHSLDLDHHLPHHHHHSHSSHLPLLQDIQKL